ncbi:MAG: hypothetical protein F2520_03185 [Actinobacteria bacterium]|uniref:Unannotated protein n=1 Tax=freshwater metagenome TaxID=449393 RepID=A0A6J7JDE4_9ZZZZ|nr:hypothetical protein [Actinomycetota bacterium]MTA77248.1 hypothetical protein [Actinomycetota bacterium]
MTADHTPIAPSDATIALRSFPRRYSALVLPIADPVMEARSQQVGPEGVSALELTADTVRTWLIQREALRQTQVHDFPIFHPAILDPAERNWHNPVVDSCDAVLDQLADLATDLADDLGSIHGDQWYRSGTIAGGGSVTALEILDAAVVVGAENLRRIERILASIRN